MADCRPPGPTGFLGSVTSWGTASNGLLYMLDGDGHVVFAVEPTPPPA